MNVEKKFLLAKEPNRNMWNTLRVSKTSVWHYQYDMAAVQRWYRIAHDHEQVSWWALPNIVQLQNLMLPEIRS